MSPDVLRLLDANVNRASEGLRVLEDIARFTANDAALSTEVRGMRHALADLVKPWDAQLVSRRDSEGDVGRESGLRVGGERNLLSVIRANAKRVEESLRVIEEVSRLSGCDARLDVAVAERLRYASYDIEKRLAGRVARSLRAASVRDLYVVVDRQASGTRSLIDLAVESIDGGATVIQLRDKTGERGAVYRTAKELNELCRRREVLFVVNDYCDVAAAVGAAGVHIGQKDMPLEAVRRIVSLDTIVGVSCETADEVRVAVAEGADYVAVGAVYPTTQKADHVLSGLESVRAARNLVGPVPLVAIGGINLANVADVVNAGADAVAVIGAVTMQPDVRQAAADMVAAIRRAKGEQNEHEQRAA